MNNKVRNIATMSVREIQDLESGQEVLLPEITNPAYAHTKRSYRYKLNTVVATVEISKIYGFYRIRTTQVSGSGDKTYYLACKDISRCSLGYKTLIKGAYNLAHILRTKQYHLKPDKE